MNLLFFKNVINSDPPEVSGYSFQDFYLSVIPTTGKNF